ncbi:MAG: DUF2508 family protein [Firmicutes bacterium]|nr:DUF2508 family protein [Bacillota bacterium]
MKAKQNRKLQDALLFDSITAARSELDRATLIFNELTDDNGVDYASYNLLAARAKYSYLLKIAKEKNLSV